jgi:DNA repair exonuclease SbcCD ATPase subunit
MNAVVEIEPLAIAEYTPTAAALADLRARLANVAYDVSTTKGMDIAKKDRAEVRGLRIALEAKRVELKAPALERSRLIDAEAKALTAELLALEKPIDDQIKAEERRKEAEKAAREQAEREAAAMVQGRIDAIRAFAIIPAGVKAAGIHVAIENLSAVEISIEAFGDRAGEAAQAKAQTLALLNDLHAAATAHEAEQARMAAEREELARQRAEQEARDKAERERIAAAQKAEADRLAAERKAFEQEQAAARAEAKKREDADRARRDEEDRKAREARAAEDRRLAQERAELEAQQRALREAEEAKAAAARRAEQEAADKAAAAERKRLDEIAAAERAEKDRQDAERAAKAQAEYDALMKAAADLKRLHDAAPAMLGALQVVAATPRIPRDVLAVVNDAISLATPGEDA